MAVQITRDGNGRMNPSTDDILHNLEELADFAEDLEAGTAEIPLPSGALALASGKIFVGQVTGLAGQATPSGDFTISVAGVATVSGATAAFNVGTNVTMTKEVAHTISVTTSTTADTAGAALTVAAATGFGTGAGGLLTLSGGDSGAGATGAGGAVLVEGGAALSTNGAGGAASLEGGLGNGTGAGGVATVAAGAGGASGAGGGVVIYGADGGSSAGNGGPVAISGGNATANNDDGGDVTLTGGENHGTGNPGRIKLNAEILVQQDAPTAKTTSATLTAAELSVGIITVNQGAGGTSALQLPDGTALDALFNTAEVENAFDFSVINISTVDAEDASITVNTGVTIVGSADIPAYSAAGSLNSSARFRLRKTGEATWVCYRLS